MPTLNAASDLPATLAALGSGIGSGLLREVILADGGSSDDTEAIAEATGARLVSAPRGRGTQLRAGAEAAKGDWLLFLHADTRLPPDWPGLCARHIETRPDQAGWFALGFDADGIAPKLVAAWAGLRARLGLPYGDQALLISRPLYEAVGGYKPMALMEDVEMARALGRRRLAGLGGRVVTSAARYQREGWLARGARNLTCLALHLAGAGPERVAARYRGRV